MSEAKGSASDIVISGQKYDDQSQITQTTQNSFQVNPSPKKRKEFFNKKKKNNPFLINRNSPYWSHNRSYSYIKS